MNLNFFQRTPRCLEDKAYTKLRACLIKTSDKNFVNAFRYCEKCKQYITEKGMEKDIRKVALAFVQGFNGSYELSDILDIEVKEL